MPPKRKNTEESDLRLPDPPAKSYSLRDVKIGVVADDCIHIGHLKERESAREESLRYGGGGDRNRPRIVASATLLELQYPMSYTLELKRLFQDVPKETGFMKATTGKGIKPGLEERFRQHVMKRYNDNADSNGTTLATLFIEGLEKTASVREKDNLYHLYALFAPSVRSTSELERIFLWLITGSSVKNKHGKLITQEHVHDICGLLEAEGRFGMPELWIKGKNGAFQRYSQLDLSHIAADLSFVLCRQRVTGTFVRPLCPSLTCADGYQNGIKPGLCAYYGLSQMMNPHYSGY